VVVVGDAVTVTVLVADKPDEGDQTYVLPPLAVKLWLPPAAMVGEAGLTVIDGRAFTVMVLVAVQPLLSV
jgi:hypothetical protein